MVKTRRLIALALALVLAAALLAGCGQTQSPGSSTTPDASTASTSPATTDQTEEVPEIWIFQNFGRIASEGSVGSAAADLEMVTNYILENAGVKLNAIVPPVGSEEEKLSLRLSSGDPIDIFSGDWRKYYTTGVALELTDYIDQMTNYGKNWSSIDPNWKDVVTDAEGKIWGLPNTTALSAYPIFVRQDWLDELNLPMPTTIDELEDVLEAFKQNDMSGTGETIPLLTTTVKDLFQCLAGAWLPMDEAGNWIDENGNVMPVQLHPEYKSFVARMADWYKKGYIYKESFQINRARTAELISQNKVGVNALWYSYTTVPLPDLKSNVPEANYVAADISGPAGYSQIINGPRYGDSVVINSKTTVIDGIIKYINWLHSDVENYIVVRNGIKDVHWKYLDGKDGSDGKIRLLEWINQTGYVGEYEGLGSMYISLNYAFAVNGQLHPTGAYFPKLLDFSKVKYQGDYSAYYDLDKIDTVCAHRGDIERLNTEEIVKFITGARPMSDWDAFVKQLYDAGIEEWIAAYTEQYQKQN